MAFTFFQKGVNHVEIMVQVRIVGQRLWHEPFTHGLPREHTLITRDGRIERQGGREGRPWSDV